MATTANRGLADRRESILLETLEPRVLLDASQAIQLFQTSPALFVENQGQWADSSVRYVHNGDGVNVAMTEAGVSFQVFGDSTATSFSASFVGANALLPVGLEKSDSTFNYFLGEQAAWRSNVPAYESVAYEELYAGIDLQTWGQRDSLKYEFHVAPGADWRQIVVHYDGIAGLSINADGSLAIDLDGDWGQIVDAAPYIYQVVDGRQVQVAGEFVLLGDSSYGFALIGAYDPAGELVIDPSVGWATLLGGSDRDPGYAVSIDPFGDVFVAGSTWSSDFPTPSGFDTSYGGGDAQDGFVAKFGSGGNLLWATYFGGSSTDVAAAVATDAHGYAVVVGYTYSSNLPAFGAFDSSFNSAGTGYEDGFVAKFSPSGTLTWSGFLGGYAPDNASGVAIDSGGNILVTGGTMSTDFPVAGGFQTLLNGTTSYDWTADAFVTKLSSSGAILWSSFLGAYGHDYGTAVCADPSGNALLAGWTQSADFPVLAGFDMGFNGAMDAFVTKVSPLGQVLWSTFLGGGLDDLATAIAADSGGDIIVAGTAESADFPVPGGYDTTFNGRGDGYVGDVVVARFAPTGSLIWATYLGGTETDSATGVAVDAAGNAYVTGSTVNSYAFPTTGGFDTVVNSNRFEGFATCFAPAGGLVWSSFLTGSAGANAKGISVDPAGNAVVVGSTSSTDLATPGAYDTTLGGSYDTFVLRIVNSGGPRDLVLSNGTVPENTLPGAVIGTFSPIGSDAGLSFTYALVDGRGDADNGSFQIVENQLVVAESLRYGSNNSRTIQVRGTDQNGLWYERAFTITVTDLNLAPTDIGLTAATIGGGQAAGANVGPLTAVDAEAPAAPFTYTLVTGAGDTDNACFVIADGQLKTTALQLTNPKAAYSVRIRATDAGGMWYEEAFLLAAWLPGDANRDGTVNLEDFGILKSFFGMAGGRWDFGDFNGDRAIDLQDFGLLKVHFGLSSPLAARSPAAIPAVSPDVEQGADDDTAGIDPAALVLAPELNVAAW